MTATSVSSGYSAGTPSDGFVLMTPRVVDPSKPLIVYGHGATSTGTQLINPPLWPNLSSIFSAIVGAGYTVIAPTAGGDSWGNAAALGLVTDAVTYGQARGTKSGKVILMGGSMGGGCSYAWARANLASVAALCLIEPVSDLQDFVTNNRQGLASSVNAAYSGAYSDASYGATHNPAKFASQLVGLPTQVWYATDDTTVIPATVTTVTTAIGGVDLHTLTGGHSDVAYSGIDKTTLLNFLKAHS